MQLSCDRAGFPKVEVKKMGLSVSLLPTTKLEFERFLAEPNEFGNRWYEEVLKISPRVSWKRALKEDRERLFITGILPTEALEFARWQGQGFDLPSADEWRQIYRAFIRSPLDPGLPRLLSNLPLNGAARSILQGIIDEVQPRTWGELALLRGGLLEWVSCEGGFKGMGVPRPLFFVNTYNPEQDEPVRAFNDRLFFFGFRLVRRFQDSR